MFGVIPALQPFFRNRLSLVRPARSADPLFVHCSFLPLDFKLLSGRAFVYAPCSSTTWKHDLGVLCGPYEYFLFSLLLESFAIR